MAATLERLKLKKLKTLPMLGRVFTRFDGDNCQFRGLGDRGEKEV